MRDFLRHLRAAWNYGRIFPYIPQADAKEFWTHSDEQSLQHFFNSDTGQKLKIRLTNYTTRMALAAVQNPNCSPYVNGQASGVAACIAAIDAHYPQENEPEVEHEVEHENAVNAVMEAS